MRMGCFIDLKLDLVLLAPIQTDRHGIVSISVHNKEEKGLQLRIILRWFSVRASRRFPRVLQMLLFENARFHALDLCTPSSVLFK